MSKHRVVLLLLPQSAHELESISDVCHVWAIHSPENDSAANRVWERPRSRDHDPGSGECLSPDPAGLWRLGQGNGYSAFGSDPWNRRDPWGVSVG